MCRFCPLRQFPLIEMQIANLAVLLKEDQIPHVKTCLDQCQFTCPSPALRYSKALRRKLCSVPEPMLFGLPIQYDNHSIDRKKFSIEKLCEWPFAGMSEYLRSYRSYTVDEIQSHRGQRPFKEHEFLKQDLEPMAQFTTYNKAFQDPRFFDENSKSNSNLLQLNRCQS
ncbi:unnamed protein product [Rotaria sp. Silwood1]|nr:unnamed protein product [Rotaria sp. Silwood1]